MTWRNAIVLARRSVGRRGGRALLTVLAVALGAALLSSLLIASSAAKQRVLDQVSEGGPLAAIQVAPAVPNPGSLDTDNPSPGPPHALDDHALARIAKLANVVSVVPVVTTPILIVPPTMLPDGTRLSRPDRGPIFDSIVGIDLSRARDVPLTVLDGRLPQINSTTEVAVTLDFLSRIGIDQTKAANVLGTELTLGAPRAMGDGRSRRFLARWTRVVIVGVVAQDASNGLLLAPLSVARTARAWTLAGSAIDDLGASPSPYSALFVVAHGLGHVPDVRAEINAVGYSTSASETLIAQVQRYLHVVSLVLAGIGLIGLAIAALGISNAMLAAIRERRREIGVLKALGAADRDVRRVFLVEAGTLGFVGGVAGTTLGFAVASLLAAVVNRYLASQSLQTVNFGFPAALLAAVVTGATLLALAAGTIPALRAARMPARQAISDE